MWILKAAEKGRGGGLTRGQRIAREVLGVLEGGGVLARKEEVHKLGAVNRWVGVSADAFSLWKSSTDGCVLHFLRSNLNTR